MAASYNEKLAACGSITTPLEDGIGVPVYHQYTLLSEARDAISAALKAVDIASAVYYPVPLHQQRAFADSVSADNQFSITEYTAKHCLSLPLYPELGEQDIEQIAAIVTASA